LLDELLANALGMASPHELTISLSIEGSSAVIRFDNEGRGLGPAELQSVFLLLSGSAIPDGTLRADLSARLTRIRSLAKAQGSLVEVRSVGKNSGCTFSLRLPMLPHAADWDTVQAAMRP
jgi:signal transduction histidine kinase